MYDPFSKPVVVIDNGSYNIKAGFACDNHPISIFRTTVGRPKYLKGTYGKTPYDVYIGDEAVARMADLDLNYPVMRGKIAHWDDMERVWHHIFYRELRVAPEDRAVLLSCAPATTMLDKSKCCEVFFETLNTPSLCIKTQSILALFGSGFTTGLSVDLGCHLTEIHPIYDGGSVTYANMGTKIAGKEVQNYIKDSLEKRGVQLGPKADDIIEDMMTKYLYVTADGTKTKKEYLTNYKLPSGEVIDVNEEIYNAGEMYFQPKTILGENTLGLSLQDAIVTAVLKCDLDLQSVMYSGIVTHGGMSTMKGLNERLAREVSTIIERPIKIKDCTELYALAWLGGAVFSGIVEARKAWVSKKQFEEYGDKIIKSRIKCCEIFFETLNAPALCVKPQSFLALFGSGFTTGLSVDLGEDTTEINPIYEGGNVSYANMVTNVAGNEIKKWIKQRLTKRGIDLGDRQTSDETINKLWDLFYITDNCAVTKEQYKKEYKLPSGQIIDVSDEVFMAGETYFQPELVLGEASVKLPIHEAMVTSILKLDEELQSAMYTAVVTHGGLLTIPGFNKRLAKEVEAITHRRVYIAETSESYASAWMGGSVFAEMAGAEKLWVHKKQYEEYGARVVRNKFL